MPEKRFEPQSEEPKREFSSNEIRESLNHIKILISHPSFSARKEVGLAELALKSAKNLELIELALAGVPGIVIQKGVLEIGSDKAGLISKLETAITNIPKIKKLRNFTEKSTLAKTRVMGFLEKYKGTHFTISDIYKNAGYVEMKILKQTLANYINEGKIKTAVEKGPNSNKTYQYYWIE